MKRLIKSSCPRSYNRGPEDTTAGMFRKEIIWWVLLPWTRPSNKHYIYVICFRDRPPMKPVIARHAPAE